MRKILFYYHPPPQANAQFISILRKKNLNIGKELSKIFS